MRVLHSIGIWISDWLRGARGGAAAADGAASLRKRREVLDARLDIDEPRACSHFRVACTCWSFCGPAEVEAAPAPDASAAARECARRDLSLLQPLPPVRRSGAECCPFRYAAPVAQRPSAHGSASPACAGKISAGDSSAS